MKAKAKAKLILLAAALARAIVPFLPPLVALGIRLLVAVDGFSFTMVRGYQIAIIVTMYFYLAFRSLGNDGAQRGNRVMFAFKVFNFVIMIIAAFWIFIDAIMEYGTQENPFVFDFTHVGLGIAFFIVGFIAILLFEIAKLIYHSPQTGG